MRACGNIVNATTACAPHGHGFQMTCYPSPLLLRSFFASNAKWPPPLAMPPCFTDVIYVESLLHFCTPLAWKRCLNLSPLICAAIHAKLERPCIPPLLPRDQRIEEIAFQAGLPATEALRATCRRMLWQTQPMWSFLVFMYDDF